MPQRINREHAKNEDDEEEGEEEEKGGAGTVTSEDFVKFDELLNDKNSLPYLKSVDITYLKSRHFQLDKWSSPVILSNQWMKRIYRNDVYHDTDFPEPEPERLSPYQLKLLNDHVKQSRHRDELHTIFKTRRKPPLDCMLECLGRPALSVDSRREKLGDKDLLARRQSSKVGQPLSSLNDDNIAVCSKHKVQPEDVIVKIALEKMRNLSFEEEQRYQELLRDQEFMEALNRCVEKYLGRDRAEKSAHVLSDEQPQPHNNKSSPCE